MIESRTGGMITFAGAVLAAYVAASLAVQGGSALLAVVAIPFLLTILIFPDVGIVGFTIFYPLLPTSEGISMAEVASAAILILLVFAWFFLVEFKAFPSHSPRRLVPLVALFGAWLSLSLAIRIYYGGSGMDWVRDIVPLANLALLLPVKDFFWRRVPFQRFLTLFVLVLILVNTRSAMGFLGMRFPVKFVMHGTTYHPVVLMLIGLALVVSSGRTRLLGLVSVFVTFVFMIGTTNRTSFIAIVLGMALFALMRSTRGTTLVLAAAATLIGYFAYLGVMEFRPESLAEKRARLESLMATDQDLSFQNRKDEVLECWRIFLAHPVAGVGLGYPYHFWRHHIQGLGPGYMDTNFTHSDFMNLLAKTGGIGALLWILLVGTLLVIGLDAIRLAREGDPDRDIAIALTLSIFMAQVVGQSTPVMQSREAMFLFGIVAGLLVALHHRVSAEAKREKEDAEEAA